MNVFRHFSIRFTAILLLLLAGGAFSLLQAQSSLAGSWEGHIEVQGNRLQIITHFRAAGDTAWRGTLDIPIQMANDVPLQDISVSGDSATFAFISVTGIARFEGSFDGTDRISGQFHQSGMQFPFLLQKESGEPADPLPYGEEELEIMNGDVRIAGTLTIPEGEGPFPATVLLTGSGAQNRNEEIFGFEIFRVIADHLTRNGIAVFRYDDRGVGYSTGSLNDATAEDLKGDLEAVIARLAGHAAVDSGRIGAMGHSQGGIIGGAVASDAGTPLDFLVLMAAPAQPLSSAILQQVEAALREQGEPDSTIQNQLALQQAIFDTLRGSGDFDAVRERLIDQMMQQFDSLPDSTRLMIEDPRRMAEDQVNMQLGALRSPSFASFVDYDPAENLREMNVPVLVLFGGRDQQISQDPHMRLTAEALEASGVNYRIEVFPSANHLFQEAESGSPAEYGSLENAFVDGFLERVAEWILEQTEQ